MALHAWPHAMYVAPSLLLDEDAPERWRFLDYREDGQVLRLTRQRYEAIYRPDPDDQG